MKLKQVEKTLKITLLCSQQEVYVLQYRSRFYLSGYRNTMFLVLQVVQLSRWLEAHWETLQVQVILN